MQSHDSQLGPQPSSGSGSRSLGEIAAEIGHDLNNLVGVIGGRSELALLQLGRGRAEEAQRCLEAVRSQLPRLQLLAERLRGLRRLACEQGGVDVRALLDRVTAQAAAAEVVTAHSEGCEKPPLALADPGLLAEAIGEALRIAAPSPVKFVLCAEAPRVQLSIDATEAAEAVSRRILGEVARILAPTRAVVECAFVSERCTIVIRLPAASTAAPILDPAEASG
jgi:signal transduction histidine kinase